MYKILVLELFNKKQIMKISILPKIDINLIFYKYFIDLFSQSCIIKDETLIIGEYVDCLGNRQHNKVYQR